MSKVDKSGKRYRLKPIWFEWQGEGSWRHPEDMSYADPPRSKGIRPVRRESDIQRAILDYLKARRIFAWRSNQIPAPAGDGKFRRFAGLKGVSDILAILPGGRILCIEVKSERGRLSAEQNTFGSQVIDLGGVWFVARSVEDVERGLERFLTPSEKEYLK